MKKIATILALSLVTFLMIVHSCEAFQAHVRWDDNPANNNSFVRYRLYYSNSANLPFDGIQAVEGPSPIDVGYTNSYNINFSVPDETIMYLTLTAYYPTDANVDGAGFESVFSNIVAKFFSPEPVDITVPTLTIP